MMKKWEFGAVIGAIIGAFYTVSCPLFYILFTVADKQSSFSTSLAPILCEELSAPSVFWFIVETLSGIFCVSPIAVHKFFFSSNASFKLLVMLIIATWSGIGALIGAGTGYLMGKYRGQEISIMKIKKDLKIGALAGITGFFLTLLFWYFIFAGDFNWKVPAAIGTVCFFGWISGINIVRVMYKTGEDI
jgi:hypothetical protein